MIFKTERHQLNYNLHRIAINIAGKNHYRQLLDDMIVNQIIKRAEIPSIQGKISCSLLTDDEAKILLKELRKIKRPGYKHTKQDKLIMKLSKYKFSWSNESIFNYMIESVPEVRKRLTNYELRNPKINTLFRILNSAQKNKIIKRLLMIELKFKRIKNESANQTYE